MDEEKLIKQAQNGDWQGFEDIVKKYQGKVYNIALMLTKDSIQAEELSQQAFIKIWKKIGKFNFRSSFSTWLYRLVHNTYYDYLRSQAKRHQREVSIDRIYDIKSPDTPEKELQKDELKDLVKRALDKLPLKLRLVVIYYDLSGLSYSEIASISKRPIGTVKSQLFRGRKLLRKELGNIYDIAIV